MFEYKDNTFYNDYFKNLNDFELVQEFGLSKDNDEKNMYVGEIKAKECIHPLTIHVTIPITFPHNKLMFRTLSLSGYPHLIHSGNTKYGDWFCLNTPFGETAENQLDLEIYRLREWIKRQIRKELPAKITDPKFSRALLIANAYEWEIPDEMDALRKDAPITFIGNPSRIIPEGDKKGLLHCIRTQDNKYYIISNEEGSNCQIPYVLVDRVPNDIESIKEMFSMANYYGWGDDVVNHLLPDFKLKKEWRISSTSITDKEVERDKKTERDKKIRWPKFGEDIFKKYSGPEALSILKEAMNNLQNNGQFSIKQGRKNNPTIVRRTLNKEEKTLLEAQIKSIISKTETEGGYDPNPSYWESCLQSCNFSEESYRLEHEMELYYYDYHYFAVGQREGDEIQWEFFYTNRENGESEQESIDIGVCWINLSRPHTQLLLNCSTQTLEEKHFFGRGVFSPTLRNKKIAIVGLGAIGSMVAESLARSGVPAIGLWDSDTIEPGNICRSTYHIEEIGKYKSKVIKDHILRIDPFINVNEISCKQESFYGNINYSSQEKAMSQISEYDVIIDCTGSNELLHFISYAAPDKDILSLCITNHAKNLLMFTNRDGNPFELRKSYLSKIEQDTKNFYIEGTGCYSPTFLATNSSIAALVNMAVGILNDGVESDNLHSVILSYDKRGIVAERLILYKLKGYDLTMTISTEVMLDGEDIPDVEDGHLGFLFGSYSANGKQIMVTHMIPSFSSQKQLEYAFKTSSGIIDYIGDFVYSESEDNTFSDEALATIEDKAENSNINTNNPLLAVRNPEGTISFFLYLNRELIPFEKTTD